MNIKIVCPGKLKEAYLTEAVSDYKKRLSRFASVEIIEVADEKIPENASKAQEIIAMEKEGERILSRISDNEYVIALAIHGKTYSSEAFASHLEHLFSNGKGRLAFVIGGSLGLSDSVYRRADEQISMSEMTFPHRIARILILEQIYRSFKILNHETYHK